jgi:hypothetical protein
MRSFWSDPYLWIHLAGLAALPLWLGLCWLGLAAGNPVLPFWLELLLVAAIGIAPIFWMQWQRPFYIFSLIGVALKPAQLTENQRRLLTLFKAPRNRYLAIAPAIVAFFALRQLYILAPIAAPVTPFAAETRWLGLLVTAIAFLGVNLFLQVPASVLSVMLTGESTFTATIPYPLEKIPSDFTPLGIPVNHILPPVTAAPEPEPVAELERLTDDAAPEPSRTEEDLDADVWEDAPIAPDPNIDSETVAAQESAVSSEAVATSEATIAEVTESEITIAEVMISDTLISSEVILSEVTISEAIIALEDTGNEPLSQPEAVADAEASIPAEAVTPTQAVTPSDAEELPTVEDGAIDPDPLPSTHQDPEHPKE